MAAQLVIFVGLAIVGTVVARETSLFTIISL